ncbi:pseudaminic acid synthase [Pigmentibacter ruber]|uniref:pseudaminic acid synthase n=1 Tax=Pigmentibacter ruber TaxID=2683196 RepID=UPI00131DBC64|nr:pseudaminic acid synthase [Pigmentibacter ruber]
MSDSFLIENRGIGSNYPPFIIAELSGNHNQSLDRALKLVAEAAKAGAHAIKLQTYTADTITLNSAKSDFMINDKASLWYGRKLYDLYDEAHTPWEWHKAIFEKCKSLGLIVFSTPFDETAVDFLESLGAPCYKIASFELVDLELIKKVAQTKKPIIMSTGMANVSEINEAISVARKFGATDIVILKCTSSYPASPINTNILTIPNMRDTFGVQVGLSDHTMGIGVSVASVALGATVIEKHFTLSRSEGGVDSAFSLEPDELQSLVIETKRAWESLGKVAYGPTESEKNSLQFRRSLYVSSNIKKGELFSKENIRIVRPGFGLEPKFIHLVLGKKAPSDLEVGTAVTWDVILG